MKLLVITNGDGPETRAALETADFLTEEGYEVERFDWETDEAATLAGLHDIYSQPAFIVVRDDGSQVDLWQGEQMPLISEIKHLMQDDKGTFTKLFEYICKRLFCPYIRSDYTKLCAWHAEVQAVRV